MSAKLFVNLPTKNLDKSIEFFKGLGFSFNSEFTNEHAACMIISEEIHAMLLVEEYFKTFTKKSVSDAAESTEVILALSVESREKVDEMVKKALATGGKPSNDLMDHEFMYGWSFQDLDGHLWEVFHMEPGKVQ